GIEHMASLSGSDPAEQAVYRRVAAPVRIDPPPVTGRPTATPRNARRPTRPDGLSVVRGWAHYGAPAAFGFLDRDHREHPRCLRRVDPAGPVLGPAGRVRPAGRPATDHARLAGRPDRLGDLVRHLARDPVRDPALHRRLGAAAATPAARPGPGA